MSTHFSCVGCGKCCTDHHVPLTLAEARQWAMDGGQLIVLVEGFLVDGPGQSEQQRDHLLRRSWSVPSGQTHARVAITFAAYNVGPCRNLDEDLRCRIYQRRPLVCRIYPMEINPHIPLRPEAKDCPPEAWLDTQPVFIVGGQLQDPQLAGLIEASRQADRDDIQAKELICERLGIRTTALKGDGFTAYLPPMSAFATAIEQTQQLRHWPAASEWSFHVSGPAIAEQLQALGARVVSEAATTYAFIALQAT